MVQIKVKGDFEGLEISIEEDLDTKDFSGAINGVKTDINYFLIKMINSLSNLEKIKISQSETNRIIHLTLIY